MEHARWNIQQNPTWRTSGEDYVFEGVTYTRKVEDCTVSGYGRDFCSDRCSKYFFYGDEEELGGED